MAMIQEFYKYQGTGNDFVMIDNRENHFDKFNVSLIKRFCDRRFGIGADGLILLENDENASRHSKNTDFKMVYYNADGNQSSMCGNGGRCLVAFAKQLNIIDAETTFVATDGLHYATIGQDNVVSLQMIDVEKIKITPEYSFLNTGSPHHVQIVDALKLFDVKNNGAKIRYGDLYGKEGSNVNFVEQVDETTFTLRTYERGVEDETLACGTGATAVAIAMNASGNTTATALNLNVEGGTLKVIFDVNQGRYSNVFLIGPAEFVFKGTIVI